MIDLATVSTSGRVLAWNGRGCFSDIEKVPLDESLDHFDRYAEWVRYGNRVNECDVSDDARALVVEAYRQGAELFRQPLEARIAAVTDGVPIVGGAS